MQEKFAKIKVSIPETDLNVTIDTGRSKESPDLTQFGMQYKGKNIKLLKFEEKMLLLLLQSLISLS